MKFRKKPVIIDAVQLTWRNWNDVCDLVGEDAHERGTRGIYIDKDCKEVDDANGRLGMEIKTLEGVMLAVENDWIIRGIKGEIYPCKPDIFAATYEPVGAPSSETLTFATDREIVEQQEAKLGPIPDQHHEPLAEGIPEGCDFVPPPRDPASFPLMQEFKLP